MANGGSELGASAPDGWYATVITETASYVTFAWDTLQKHEGRRSIMIAIHPDHPGDTIAYNWTQAISAGFEPGHSYELGAWVKTTNVPETAWMLAQFWDATQTTFLGLATSQKEFILSGTGDWVRVTTSFQIPPSTGVVRLRAGIDAPVNTGGTVWFDDVTLRKS